MDEFQMENWLSVVCYYFFDKWSLLPYFFQTSSVTFERLPALRRFTLWIPIPTIRQKWRLIDSVFTVLYFISYILDALDGVCARKFDQCIYVLRVTYLVGSHFGAVLDMICDRFCTCSLYLSLTHLYPQQKYYYTLLMILEIVSHWIQMYR